MYRMPALNRQRRRRRRRPRRCRNVLHFLILRSYTLYLQASSVYIVQGAVRVRG